MEQNEEQIIKQSVEDLMKRLDIQGGFEMQFAEDIVSITLSTDDTGIVIGYHGEVLESLQLILSLIVAKQIGRFVRISVEVGDYKKNRTDWLEQLAKQTKERVLMENREIPLPNLKPWERRIVHMILKDDESVMSESVGEGKNRTLILRPR